MTQLLTNPEITKYIAHKYAKDADNNRWLRLIKASKKWESAYVDGYIDANNQKQNGLSWVFGEQMQEAIDRLTGKKYFRKTQSAEELIDFNNWNIYFEEFDQLLLPYVVGEWGQAELNRIIVSIGFDVSNGRVLDFIANYAYKFRGINEETASVLNKALQEAVNAGEGIPQITKRIQALFEDMQKERAYLIARTETMRAMNFASEDGYIQSGVVASKKWLTAIDERTCVFCNEMNGKILGLGGKWYEQGDVMEVITEDGKKHSLPLDYEPIFRPPLHPKCRCCLSPIVIV